MNAEFCSQYQSLNLQVRFPGLTFTKAAPFLPDNAVIRCLHRQTDEDITRLREKGRLNPQIRGRRSKLRPTCRRRRRGAIRLSLLLLWFRRRSAFLAKWDSRFGACRQSATQVGVWQIIRLGICHSRFV